MPTNAIEHETKLAKPTNAITPPELWMLWDTEEGNWVEAIDDDEAYLVYTSREDAEKGALNQFEIYDVRSRPTRVR